MYDSTTDPHIGERVLFVDTDGETHHAIVVDDCPGDEYVTLVHGTDGQQLGEDYHHEVESESSVYPHKHVSEESTADTHVFLPIHWSYDGEYDYDEEE